MKTIETRSGENNKRKMYNQTEKVEEINRREKKRSK